MVTTPFFKNLTNAACDTLLQGFVNDTVTPGMVTPPKEIVASVISIFW